MTTETKVTHTPGPWHAIEVGETGSIQGSPSIPVFDVVGPNDNYRIVTAAGEGNAHLIAAAPDMLEALEQVIRVLEGEADTAKMVMAAIRKAKGGAA